MNDTDNEAPGGPHPAVESTDAVALFPTFVWKTQVQEHDHRRINEGIKRRLKAMTHDLAPLAPGGKWQTEQRLHELPEFQELNELVHGAASGVLAFLKLVHNPMRITGCWANISAPGATHKPHTHPNNFLSGVYYVQTDSGADRITFDDPRPQTNIISPQVREPTEENAGQIHLGVREGLLVLFPSWLQHSVPQNQSDRERISIAINLMFTRYGEEMAGPKWEGNVPVRQ